MKTITLKNVRDDWEACYEPDRLAELFNRPCTPIEVLTRADGAWASVPDADRLRVILRPEVVPERIARLFAAWCARQALRIAGGPDPHSLAAIEAAERFAESGAPEDKLGEARMSAWEAAVHARRRPRTAALAVYAAVRATQASAWRAAREAAWSASAAADAAVWAAAGVEARDAAPPTARAAIGAAAWDAASPTTRAAMWNTVQAVQADQADQAARAEQVRQLAKLLSESETA